MIKFAFLHLILSQTQKLWAHVVGFLLVVEQTGTWLDEKRSQNLEVGGYKLMFVRSSSWQSSNFIFNQNNTELSKKLYFLDVFKCNKFYPLHCMCVFMLYKYYIYAIFTVEKYWLMKWIKILKNQEGNLDLSKYTVCNCVLSRIPLSPVVKETGLDQTFGCTCNITVSEDGNLWLHGCSRRKPEGSLILWTCEIQGTLIIGFL